jgi:hypothetical protein
MNTSLFLIIWGVLVVFFASLARKASKKDAEMRKITRAEFPKLNKRRKTDLRRGNETENC